MTPDFAAFSGDSTHRLSRGGQRVRARRLSPLRPLWPPRRRISGIALATFAVITLVYFAVTDPVSVERWRSTYYEGDVATRDRIYSAAADMISEQPLFGWQPITFFYELGRRTGTVGDPRMPTIFSCI